MYRKTQSEFNTIKKKKKSSSVSTKSFRQLISNHQYPSLKLLLDWFSKNQRDLPWRINRTPYRVLVSEFMLQQTRVQTVIPYFQKWMKQYPSTKKLAQAPIQDVLKLWEGLGYYRRAIYLHKIAQSLINEKKSSLPNSYEELIQWNGIGKYTAAAIMVFAYRQPQSVIDGNIARVLSRWFLLPLNFREESHKKIFEKVMELVIENWSIDRNLRNENKTKEQVATAIEAVMELGATICLPRRPSCNNCPVSRTCQSKKQNLQHNFPLRLQKQKIPTMDISVGILIKNKKILLGKRKETGFLGGLWELPGGKVEAQETPEIAIIREFKEETGLSISVRQKLNPVRHTFSHFKIRMHPFVVTKVRGNLKAISAEKIGYFSKNETINLPFPKATKLVLEQYGWLT